MPRFGIAIAESRTPQVHSQTFTLTSSSIELRVGYGLRESMGNWLRPFVPYSDSSVYEDLSYTLSVVPTSFRLAALFGRPYEFSVLLPWIHYPTLKL